MHRQCTSSPPRPEGVKRRKTDQNPKGCPAHVSSKYYPSEMSDERANAYIHGKLRKPYDELAEAEKPCEALDKRIKVSGVMHWFKWDLRLTDNRALAASSERAQQNGVPFLCLYVFSPEDYEAHCTSPARVDFLLRTLPILRKSLGALEIPLHIEIVPSKKQVVAHVLRLLSKWEISHLYCNREYEVDELRREAELARACVKQRKVLKVFDDTCVVPPRTVATKNDKPHAVFSPYFRAWQEYVCNNKDCLRLSDSPKLFESQRANQLQQKLSGFTDRIPNAPTTKSLSPSEAQHLRELWPAGEQEALERLKSFCQKRVNTYKKERNILAHDGTSRLSVHFAAGTLSTRTAVCEALNGTRLNSVSENVLTWVSEIAWRDFYKHIVVEWPYVCMNKPFKIDHVRIPWSYDKDRFSAWCKGLTGFPIVDAAMRELMTSAYMHNRCRMIADSFLTKDLLIDWRMGERHFMNHLIDGDFASNNGGWGWSASMGADPQPFFRVFNPVLQSEKFDPNGDYIRRWVPELRSIKGKAIHDPYERGADKEASLAGYPRAIVDHSRSRIQALAAFKSIKLSTGRRRY